MNKFMGVGVAVGVGLGAAIGAPIHNLPVWVGIGGAIGVVLALILNRSKRASNSLKQGRVEQATSTGCVKSLKMC